MSQLAGTPGQEVVRLRFVPCSDLRLDTTFSWAPPATTRRRRQALGNVLGHIPALADEADADAIPSGDDLYEHERFEQDLPYDFGVLELRQAAVTIANHARMLRPLFSI